MQKAFHHHTEHFIFDNNEKHCRVWQKTYVKLNQQSADTQTKLYDKKKVIHLYKMTAEYSLNSTQIRHTENR